MSDLTPGEVISAAVDAISAALDNGPPPAPPDSGDAPPQPRDRATAAGSGSILPDPVGELRFQVRINDIVIGAFAECTGLSAEYDIFEYQEGGELHFVHKFRGSLKYPNLVLKRGVTHEDALVKWFFDRSANVDRRKNRSTITVDLLGDDGEPVRSWAFTSAFPVKWQGPSFNAKSTNVAMETLEIAHQGFMPQS